MFNPRHKSRRARASLSCYTCVRARARGGRQKTRDGTREERKDRRTQPRKHEGQPSTSNSNQRRQTRCVNMTCLLRETWEVPSTACVRIYSGKDCERSFHRRLRGSSRLASLLVTHSPRSVSSLYPLYCRAYTHTVASAARDCDR